MRPASSFRPADIARYDCAAFYGLEGNLTEAFAQFSAEKEAVYVDLGYWGRHEGGRWTGYHKVVVNSRHPTTYFRRIPKPDDRLSMFHVEPSPWRREGDGKHILLVGMSEKAAQHVGFEAEQWEYSVVDELRYCRTREIIYRPKPNWSGARAIPGSTFSGRKRDLADDLNNCWAVVTHHSNAAVEALMLGVPVFCTTGVAAPMGKDPFSGELYEPYYPPDRAQWAADLAYTQWSVEEIRQGLAWRHLKAEGLLRAH